MHAAVAKTGCINGASNMAPITTAAESADRPITATTTAEVVDVMSQALPAVASTDVVPKQVTQPAVTPGPSVDPSKNDQGDLKVPPPAPRTWAWLAAQVLSPSPELLAWAASQACYALLATHSAARHSM